MSNLFVATDVFALKSEARGLSISSSITGRARGIDWSFSNERLDSMLGFWLDNGVRCSILSDEGRAAGAECGRGLAVIFRTELKSELRLSSCQSGGSSLSSSMQSSYSIDLALAMLDPAPNTLRRFDDGEGRLIGTLSTLTICPSSSGQASVAASVSL